MTLDRIFAIWDWPTVIGLVLLGLIVGAVLIPMTWPVRTILIPSFPVMLSGVIWIAAGAAFFIFLWLFRTLNAIPNAERTLATGVQWVLFATAMSVGLKFRDGVTS